MSDFASIHRVSPHPANVRSDLGDLTELTESIRAQGILQPIVVQPDPRRHGCYVALGGHRRLAAAKLAGLDEVPIVVRAAAGPASAIEVMLVENCHRADLNPMDKAEAMGRLIGLGYTQAAIARATGLSSATVSTSLALLELDEGSRERVRASQVSAATAVAAVRGFRKKQRQRNGEKPQGPVWEPDYLTAAHPLARKARQLCDAREHTARRRYGKVACGQCFETVIRADERLAVLTELGTDARGPARGRDDALAAPVPLRPGVAS